MMGKFLWYMESAALTIHIHIYWNEHFTIHKIQKIYCHFLLPLSFWLRQKCHTKKVKKLHRDKNVWVFHSKRHHFHLNISIWSLKLLFSPFKERWVGISLQRYLNKGSKLKSILLFKSTLIVVFIHYSQSIIENCSFCVFFFSSSYFVSFVHCYLLQMTLMLDFELSNA